MTRLLLALALLAALATPARAQWTPVPLPPELDPSQVAIFGFVAAIGDHVFASSGFGVFDAATSRLHYVFVSRDRGTTWAPDPTFSTSASDGGRVGLSAAADGALYIPFTRYGAGGIQTVARTTDGVAWTLPAGAGLPRAAGQGAQILSATRHAGALFATHGTNFTQGQATVFRSADEGATWAAVAPPRQTGFLWSAGSRLLIGQGSGSTVPGERSADGGVTWTPHTDTGAQFPAPRRIDDAAVAGGVALAGGLRSADGGATWMNTPVGGGSIAGCGTVFVSASPSAAAGNTVTISTDGGLSMSPWTDGLPADEAVWKVACSNEAGGTGGTAYAAGQAALYRRDLSPVVAAEGTPADEELALSVGPNPARASATLRMTLAEAQTVRVTLTDVLGREALRLDRTLPAGASAVSLDVSGLAAGVYVARLVSSGASASLRLTIIR